MALNYDVKKLNELYQDSERVDHDLFAEMKSNLLLVAGDHYTKKGSKFWDRIKDQRNVSEPLKLRLTQNHLQKISGIFQNNIVSQAPGTRVFPKNETEIQDQKAAELHQAVWEDIKLKNKYQEKISEWVADFCDIGEVAVQIVFDPNKGRFLGYKQKLQFNPLTGAQEPVFDEMGEPEAGTEAVFAGEIVLKTIHCFNLLRAKQARRMDESPYLIVRSMVDTEELKRMAGNDDEKLRFISESQDDTYKVFDGNSNGYVDTKGQDMLREFYFRPGPECPKGYFYHATSKGIIAEGELPFGIFPIEWQGYKKIQTSPRARSWIKDARPFQVEINRCASAIATTQITWGDDKLVTAAGAKMTKGVDQPGIRHIQVSGPPPTIIPGRSGEQYIAWMDKNIEGMYSALNVATESEVQAGQVDPFSMLFRQIKDKKPFVIPGKKFEAFLVRVHEKASEYAKHYLNDEHLIPAVGKKEYVNIAEFKTAEPLCYSVKVEPMTEDLESTMGKQLTINHVLQYVGKDLSKEDMGKVIRAMPFLNKEQLLDDMTLDYDNATSDILAIDRGEWREPNKYDNHKYLIKRLIKRIKQSDFVMLHPQIQDMYRKKLMLHEQLEVEQAQAIQAAQAGFIPASGYEVVCDLYAPDPNNPAKTRRVRIPSESLEWLIKKLEQQGTYTVGISGVPEGGQADMAAMMPTNHVAGPQSQSSDIARRNGPGGLNGNTGSFNAPDSRAAPGIPGASANRGEPAGIPNQGNEPAQRYQQ
jgi:hypothetical protein